MTKNLEWIEDSEIYLEGFPITFIDPQKGIKVKIEYPGQIVKIAGKTFKYLCESALEDGRTFHTFLCLGDVPDD